MDMATMLRRVKRSFGDEYDIIINDQDIFDWANEAQLRIIRETTTNDVTSSIAANTFPVGVTDRVQVKRVAINNKALVYTTQAELDSVDITLNQSGYPLYWYYEGQHVHLWPIPSQSDTYNVMVTYAKIPTPLTLVAPYLEWKNNPVTAQIATIAPDPDFDKPGFDFTVQVTLNNVSVDVPILQKGAGYVPSVLAWRMSYFGTVGNGLFSVVYSDGTIERVVALQYRPGVPIVAGEIIKLRVLYTPSTGTLYLYRINADGSQILDGTSVLGAFNVSTTPGYPISSGGPSSEPGPAPWRLHYVSIKNAAGSAIYTMDGAVDLARLPTVPATPFPVSTGQLMSVTGGLQVYSEDNVFSVPDVHHDDIINFCIAQAHRKNRDNRSYEDSMKIFDQSVTTRRHENQSIDGPVYKGADAFDHGWDWDSAYG